MAGAARAQAGTRDDAAAGRGGGAPPPPPQLALAAGAVASAPSSPEPLAAGVERAKVRMMLPSR